jgi:hypothetical protein
LQVNHVWVVDAQLAAFFNAQQALLGLD